MSESSAPISGRVIGTIDAEDVVNCGMIVRTGGTTFAVGSEVDLYLASAAKPARPDPDTMSAEEREAELDAAAGVKWLPYEDAHGFWFVVLTTDKKRRVGSKLGCETYPEALFHAVCALREHQAKEAQV